MDFHHRLKQETQSFHNQIETATLLKNILHPSVSLDNYKQLLVKFYGYIYPCENLIRHSAFHSLLIKREKTHLLQNDLITLKAHVGNNEFVLHCQNLPELDTAEQILGYLYVIEGSTLGGKIIAGHLQSILQLTPDSYSYFDCYGQSAKSFWNKFCQSLNNITDLHKQQAIIVAAKNTFTTLHNWLN